MEKLPAAAYLCDAQGRIAGYNASAVKLWGRTPKLNDAQELYCGSWKLFTAEGRRCPHDQCWGALAVKTGQDYHGREVVIERPDGTRATVLAHASAIREADQQISGMLNVLVDITERKRAEDELRESEDLSRTSGRPSRSASSV